MSDVCLQEEMIHDPLKKLLLKFSVLGRFMENLLKPSMLQGSSACEPVPGLGAGSGVCSHSADLCLAGKEQWWTLEMAVAS